MSPPARQYTEFEFSVNDPRSFKLKAHKSSELSSAVVQCSDLRPPNLLPLQNAARSDFFNVYPQHFSLSEPNLSNPEGLLRAYFQIFDKLFFFGTLGGNVFLEPRIKGSQYQHSHETGRRGLLTEISNDHRLGLIVYDDREANMSGTDWILRLLGTMLHYMILAFFRLFAARLRTDDKNYALLNFDQCGRTEHGVSWLDVAAALQWNVASENMLNLKLDLRIAKNLRKELRCSQRKEDFPWTCQLESWGLEKSDVKYTREDMEDRSKTKKGSKRANTQGVMGCTCS
ncbi:hypothetical protein B0J14DRAFT_673139 [Halenospora varia]|nr:hypothetical protein B0J14DRAFT_673139 [Halenospora varia]